MTSFKQAGGIAGKIVMLALIVVMLMFILFIPTMIIGIIITDTSLENMDTALEQLLQSPFIMKTEMFIQFVAFTGAVVIMYALFERKSGLSLGWKQPERFKASMVGSVWGIVLITLTFVGIWAFGGLQITQVHFDGDVLKGFAYAMLLFACVAINEELVSRGYIQGLIRTHFGPLIAIVITSILFACLHLGNDSILDGPLPLLNLFLAGVLFGVSREVTGGLWVPIGLHFTWNLFQGNVYGFEVSGLVIDDVIIETTRRGSDFISGGDFGAEGSLITTIILLIAIIVMWRSNQTETSNLVV